jgi:hypothetical protein
MFFDIQVGPEQGITLDSAPTINIPNTIIQTGSEDFFFGV